jgi:endo-1,4-beta-xylanase
VVAIVKHLKSRGIRIDGVGIQLHGSPTQPSAEGLEYAVTSLTAAGVKVMTTEPDIRTRTRGYRGADVGRIYRWRTRDSNADTPETRKKLAEKSTEIFSFLVKHRKDVTHVTFWYVYDGATWIGSSPLLFDRKYQPKKTFFAVVRTAQEQAVETSKCGRIAV